MPKNLNDRAREILRANDRGGFTVPAVGMYPHQWNWDSLFVALGLATFDESRACEEIQSLFEAQWEDGFVPHIVFRGDDPEYFPGPEVWQAGQTIPSSGITQPPVAATIVNELYSRVTSDDARHQLAQLFPQVLAWHRWFHRYRVPDGVDAVVIVHPWESGRDNSPEWDEPARNIDVSAVSPYQRRDLAHVDADMRPTKLDYDRYIALVEFGRDAGWNHAEIATKSPFRVADVGITMVLLRATHNLIELGEKTGNDEFRDELEGYAQQLERGTNYLWDDESGTYCSRDTITGAFSGHVTNASFLYAYAGVGSPEQRERMRSHWERISAGVRYMLPSHDPDSSKYDHVRYWRGPIWIVMNYLIARGFESCGLGKFATRIREDSRRIIEEHGFSEAYSPVTGAGTGGREFSWTAALWLAWCGRPQLQQRPD